jgi:hypothetical protein
MILLLVIIEDTLCQRFWVPRRAIVCREQGFSNPDTKDYFVW